MEPYQLMSNEKSLGKMCETAELFAIVFISELPGEEHLRFFYYLFIMRTNIF